MSAYHHTPEHRKWSKAVKARDKKCKSCGAKTKLTAHHIYDASNHPDKRHDMDNGVCLCTKCHSMFHNAFNGGWAKSCTKKGLDRFLRIAHYYLVVKQ